MSSQSNLAVDFPILRGNSSSTHTPSGRKVIPTLSIGDVLKQLQGEFPDITVSKIRFLESEGLISPERNPSSGYRRFSSKDIERLRYILETQRDQYLPLKVIKQQLEAMDSGQVTSVKSRSSSENSAPERPRVTRLTRSDLTTRSTCPDSLVASLIRLKIIQPDVAGFFSSGDVEIVKISQELLDKGVDQRFLKVMVSVAQRQASIVHAVADPILHSRDDNAEQRSMELARELSTLLTHLNDELLKSELDLN